jgi:outer membrane receptor protein involved in Fe transport
LDAISASRSQYFLTDTTYFTNDSTRNLTANESHRFNINFETKLDSLTSVYVKPSFQLDFASSDNTDITQFVTAADFQTLATNINNKNNSEGTSFNTTAGIERKFKKQKRAITADYSINIKDNNTVGNLLSQSLFASNPLLNNTIDQSKNNDNNEIKHNAYVDYTEPFGKLFKLTIGYNLALNNLNQDKSTFDLVSGQYTGFRPDLSNKFESKRVEHIAGAKFGFDNKKHSMYVRLDGRNINIQNDNLITLQEINQNVSNLLPSFKYEYKPSMSKRFSVNYTTSSELPSITDIQPVFDNSNPNRIQIGNPDLKPNYNHNINITFNTWQALSGRYVWSGLYGSITDNAFANSTSFDNFGRTVAQTKNVDGNTNLGIYAGSGIPFLGRKFTLRPEFNGTYNHYTNFVNSEENITDNLFVEPSLELRFELDSFQISIGGSYQYNNPRSSLSSVSNTPFSTQVYDASIEWNLPKGFTIKTDGNYNINGQRAEGFNISYFIWNAEISKSFLKTENLVLSVIGKDMLNQNINANRQINANVVVDNKTRIISRYFLMKLTYRFNNNKTKEQQKNGWK